MLFDRDVLKSLIITLTTSRQIVHAPDNNGSNRLEIDFGNQLSRGSRNDNGVKRKGWMRRRRGKRWESICSHPKKILNKDAMCRTRLCVRVDFTNQMAQSTMVLAFGKWQKRCHSVLLRFELKICYYGCDWLMYFFVFNPKKLLKFPTPSCS